MASRLVTVLLCASLGLAAAKRRDVKFEAPLRTAKISDVQTADPLPPWQNYTQTQMWYTQTLDHFNLVDNRTFQQRYWIVFDFWNPSNGTVIFYLCGEYTCPGVNPVRLWPLQLAYEHNALVVVLEHRYYGESQPFENLATEYLSYLNSRQAISDFAQFAGYIQQQINTNNSLPADFWSPWLIVGGSYPGALSAWYRLKFPHLSVGALSASGVVHAQLLFPEFDEQVATSAGPECTKALQAVTAAIEAGMPDVKVAFNASQLKDGDFYFFVADAGAEGVQYGHRDVLCESVVPTWRAGGDLIKAYANYTMNFFEAVMGNSVDDYDSNIIADPTLGGDDRSWWWQVCTEFGWWQVAPPAGISIRSQNVNEAWHVETCSTLFGFDSDHRPDVNGTNLYYGGANIAGTNIWFSNGIEDPWQWAGVRRNISSSELAWVVDCDLCAHCVDLYTPTANDAPNLKAEREVASSVVWQWLQQYP